MFFATLSPMLVMFCCIVIGYMLRKLNLIPENSGAVMSKLENYVFVPALIIHTFMNYCTVSSLKEYSNLILYSCLALALAMGIAIPLATVFARKNPDLCNIYRYALTFGNFGFMGNAIVPAILGASDPEILYKYLLFTLPLNVAVYSWGLVILVPRGEGKVNPLKNLLNPCIASVLIGAALGLSGLGQKLPSFAVTVVEYCKSSMAPVAMILTGFIIGGYSLKKLIGDKKIYMATGLRLFVLPAIIVAVLKGVGASDLVLTLALFAYATPLGLNTVIFPAAYGGDTRPGAAMAMISHTVCVVTIPLMFSLLDLIL